MTSLLFEVSKDWKDDDSFETLNELLRVHSNRSGKAAKVNQLEICLATFEETGIPSSLAESIDEDQTSKFMLSTDPRVQMKYLDMLVDELASGRPVSPLYSSCLWLYYLKLQANNSTALTVGRFLKRDIIDCIKVGFIVNAGNIEIFEVAPENQRPSEKMVRSVLARTYNKVSTI